MRSRYLLLAATGCGRELPDPVALARRTGLSLSLAADRFALLTAGCPAIHLAGGKGVVIGTLFARHGRARAVGTLSEEDEAAILASEGAMLLRSFWGGFVAMVPCGEGVRMLRDPCGALPCYYARCPGVLLFASDADLLIDSGLVPCRIDWGALARHLHGGGMPVRETALAGIEELLPGFSIDMGPGSLEQRQRWSPWDHVEPAPVRGRETLAEMLHRIVDHCVHAWSSRFRRVLVSVSGGLDSSIVASCLAKADVDCVCLTMFGEDPSGDEREHARRLADHLGLRLIERPFRLSDVDIFTAIDGHLPRPTGRMQDAAYERAHLEVAGAEDIDGFFTGSGGDNVLGFSQSAAAIADRWLVEGLGAGARQTLLDVCRQTGCSLAEAARAAWRIRWAPPGYCWRPDRLFLASEMIDRLGAFPRHPWLQAPPGALPGKAAHIAALLRVQQSLEPGRSRYAPVVHPLLSQPIAEFCLGIASWTWRSGGVDRAVARDAFACDLPAEVVRRRGKGGPDGFSNRLVEHHRSAIADRLLDGHLAGHKLLDRAALELVLRDARPPGGAERVRILRLGAAEAWLDCWIERCAASRRTPQHPS
ncbi:asparagine synthetase B family protein [Sphingosinicella sp. BN140058]|uniref:asparagine synthase-related protein n=1 Tax=Sphingosinicella sp. BN140058 TaxID=1892855 RepID=UPI0010113B96|nr:asparagine synthetase B family protein [Sphingosinicella sp. BN140058]QAY78187.1 asparagine synthetase B family protein [Sphingosinicella sp. BN140058]